MAIVIKADGTSYYTVPDNGKDFKLEELYKHVNCSVVECVTLADGRLMWLDEESKLADPIDWKPINIHATRLLAEAGGIPGDVVLGDVLITSRGEVE